MKLGVPLLTYYFLKVSPRILKSLVTGRSIGENQTCSEIDLDEADKENVRIYRPSEPRTAIQESQKKRFGWWFKNQDEDYAPDWRPDQTHQQRKASYARRNPLHNFTHYIIGIADQTFVRYGNDPGTTWGRNGEATNLAVIHFGNLRLPFISYRNRWIEFYIGWRTTGNFGIALRRAHLK